MNTANSWFGFANAILPLTALSLFISGCATPGPPLVTDPVGPLGASPAVFWDHPYGTLRVYTERQEVIDGDISYFPHRPYRITTREGKLVKAVRNRVGTTDQHPMMVPLEQGTYYVHAIAEGKGWVTVPVVISRNRLTVVNLHFEGLPEGDALPESERVRLPDGRVIGRRAEGGSP